MSKDTKSKVKKSFVRNTQQIKPKTVVIAEPMLEEDLSTPSIQETEPEQMPISEMAAISLQSPKQNSMLKLAKAIESVKTIKQPKMKSTINLDKRKRLIVEEKASKQVNFPYNQPIYKDLIPLCTSSRPKPAISVKQFNFQKDKEPLLGDFYTQKSLPEYSFEASVDLNHKPLTKQYDALKIYRTICNWH